MADEQYDDGTGGTETNTPNCPTLEISDSGAPSVCSLDQIFRLNGARSAHHFTTPPPHRLPSFSYNLSRGRGHLSLSGSVASANLASRLGAYMPVKYAHHVFLITSGQNAPSSTSPSQSTDLLNSQHIRIETFKGRHLAHSDSASKGETGVFSRSAKLSLSRLTRPTKV